MKRRRTIKRIALLVSLLVFAEAHAELRPLYAEYELLWRGVKTAEATLMLSRMPTEDIWHSQVHVKPAGVVAMFANEVTIEDKFVVKCRRIVPLHVEFKKRGRVYEFYRFGAKGIEVLHEGEAYHLPPVTDVLSVMMTLLQTMAESPDLSVLPKRRVASRGKVRLYRQVLRNREVIQTALGKLDTRVIEWERRGKTRYRYWLGHDYHHLPVRALRFNRSGNMVFEVVAKHIDIR